SLLSLLRMTPRPPRSPLFPYTTLFRSLRAEPRDLSEVLLHVAVVQQRLPRVRIEPDQLAQVLPEGPDSHAVSAQQRHGLAQLRQDRKSTRLNSSHVKISYAVFCLKKKN